MSNYYRLNLPIKLHDEGRLFLNNQDMLPSPENDLRWQLKFKKPSVFISQETIDFFESKNLKLYKDVMIFRGNPGSELVVHIDVYDTGYGINLAWGSRRSEMIWYEPLVPLDQSKVMTSSANTPYHYFDKRQVKEIQRAEIIGPCLVRTDIPHTVVNHDTANIRWCASIRFSGPARTWDEAVELFRPYFIN